MKRIEQLVFTLLQSNECVVIPSFGGFIVKTKSARIDYEKGIGWPAYKALSFNVKLNENDGQLIKSCCLENKLSYTESEEMIKKHVSDWNDSIFQGNRLHLENIGYFWKSEEGNVQFEQDRSFNFLLSSYGLELVEFIPIISDELEVQETDGPTKLGKKRLWKYAAAAAVVLPIAFYSYWIPAKTPALESGMISYHDFNPLEAGKQGSYKVSNISLENWEFPKLEVKELKSALNPEEKTSESKRVEPTISTVIEPSTFHLIAGCFTNLNNAKRQIARLKTLGFDTRLLQQGKLFKISIGSGFSTESLTPIQQKAKSASVDCWILKP
jgi:nucleoid DNA-binding protein